MNLKNISSMTFNGLNDYKVDKSCGPSRKTTSWTSTPDLTTLSDSITSQVDKINGKLLSNTIIHNIIISKIYN